MKADFDVDAEISALEARLKKLRHVHKLRREVAILEGRTNAPERVKKLAEIVADRRDISVGLLFSKDRTQYVAESRFIVFYLARKFVRISSTELGLIFNRDHGTVLIGLKRCKVLMDQDSMLANQVQEIESKFSATLN